MSVLPIVMQWFTIGYVVHLTYALICLTVICAGSVNMRTFIFRSYALARARISSKCSLSRDVIKFRDATSYPSRVVGVLQFFEFFHMLGWHIK